MSEFEERCHLHPFREIGAAVEGVDLYYEVDIDLRGFMLLTRS